MFRNAMLALCVTATVRNQVPWRGGSSCGARNSPLYLSGFSGYLRLFRARAMAKSPARPGGCLFLVTKVATSTIFQFHEFAVQRRQWTLVSIDELQGVLRVRSSECIGTHLAVAPRSLEAVNPPLAAECPDSPTAPSSAVFPPVRRHRRRWRPGRRAPGLPARGGRRSGTAAILGKTGGAPRWLGQSPDRIRRD